MNDNQQYLTDAHKGNRDRTFCASGQNDKNINQKNMKNGAFSADAWTGADAWTSGDGGFEAAAGQQQAAPEKSEPFIIQIVNGSTAAIANVQLFNSSSSRTLTSPYFQNNANISITSLTLLNYLQILAMSESKPFHVGEILIQSSTSGQITQPVTIAHTTDTTSASKLLTPYKDPYQQQTDEIAYSCDFFMDGATYFQLANVLASATVTIFFFPKARFSALNSVAGGNGVNRMSNPGVVRVLSASAQ